MVVISRRHGFSSSRGPAHPVRMHEAVAPLDSATFYPAECGGALADLDMVALAHSGIGFRWTSGCAAERGVRGF